MRKTIIEELAKITDFEEVYEAFLAPSGAAKPYATVKFTTTLNSINNKHGWNQPLEVYIYYPKTSFKNIDELVTDVITKLNNVSLTTDSGNTFTCELDSVLPDNTNENNDTIIKIVTFNIPKYKP
jgi:hypothetical protein